LRRAVGYGFVVLLRQSYGATTGFGVAGIALGRDSSLRKRFRIALLAGLLEDRLNRRSASFFENFVSPFP